MRWKILVIVLVMGLFTVSMAEVVQKKGSVDNKVTIEKKGFILPKAPASTSTQTPLCIAVGVQGAIVRSTDLGATWTVSTSGTDRTFFSVTHIKGKEFVASGDKGTMKISTDDGQTWTALTPPSGSGIEYRGIASDGTQRLVAVGNNGRVIVSTDLGKTWQSGSSGTTYDLNGIVYSAPRFIAVGSRTILTSSDGGMTWTSSTHPSILRHYDVAADSKGRVIVCGGGPGGVPNIPGIILTSADGGLSFTESNYKNIMWMFGIGGNGQGTWMAVGGTLAYVAISTDDGVNWTINNILNSNKTRKAVAHAGGSTWFASGYSGVMFRTTDNGMNWSEIATGVPNTLNDIVVRK
jgi:photosystem II stability/assembly factor-like uncharacterized protein